MDGLGREVRLETLQAELAAPSALPHTAERDLVLEQHVLRTPSARPHCKLKPATDLVDPHGPRLQLSGDAMDLSRICGSRR